MSAASNTTEVFLPIPGFPGYRISNMAKVESCWQFHEVGKGWSPTGPWRDRKLQVHPVDGYLYVFLWRDQKRHTRRIHRLMLETFIGPRPRGKECRHLNGDRADARLSNLVWGEPEENTADKSRHGTKVQGSKSPFAKLTEKDVLHIRWLLDQAVSGTKIAEQYSVSQATISQIKLRQKWSHVP